MKTFINFAITITAIAFSLACGKVLNHSVGGLPASLYGLLFFAGILRTGIFNSEDCGEVVSKLIYYMPIVFLPVCVGVMEYLELFTEIGLKVLFIGITTTLLGVVVVAWSGQFALSLSARADNKLAERLSNEDREQHDR